MEKPPIFFLGGGGGGDAHEPPQAQVGALGRMAGQGQDLLPFGPSFALLLANVHLQQNVLDHPHLGRLLLHGVHKALGVDGLNHIHLAHHKLHLVGLQVPDEMDPGPCVGVVLQVGHQLLHPVLSTDGDARLNGVADGLGGLDLGGCHQGDLLRVPARLEGGLTHVLPDRCHVGGNGLIALGLCHGSTYHLSIV